MAITLYGSANVFLPHDQQLNSILMCPVMSRPSPSAQGTAESASSSRFTQGPCTVSTAKLRSPLVAS
jgi:hypothetical protein